MNISIIGTGYVGLICGTCFANLGHKVICFDIDKKKIELLSEGKSPIYEPGLEELIKKNLQKGTLKFTTNAKKAVEESQIIFIAVGTPQNEKGEANLEYVKQAAKMVGQNMNDYKIIVDKSTVPVGTAKMVKGIIQEELAKRNKQIEFDVVSNPEFLAEGSAVKDFQSERAVIGSDCEKAKKIMVELYTTGFSKDKVILCTDTKSAEIIKYASNSMLALRLSFINEISQLCEEVGANIEDVSKGVGQDSRIGNKFLKAGLGYGGSCFPKDILALENTMRQNGCKPKIISQIDALNKEQLKRTLDKIKKLTGNLKGKTICVLGLAFKANTDDIRESPAIKMIQAIQKEGGNVRAYDPKAMESAQKVLNQVEYFNNAYDSAKTSDLILIATEWEEFKQLNIIKLKELMKTPNMVDGRNLFEPKEMKAIGFNYLSIGR